MRFLFNNGAVRVVTNITIDDRRDKDIHIGDKITSVNRKTKEIIDENKSPKLKI